MKIPLPPHWVGFFLELTHLLIKFARIFPALALTMIGCSETSPTDIPKNVPTSHTSGKVEVHDTTTMFEDTHYPLKELKRLESANPALDLDEAIKKNDLRFIGIHSVGTEVPNVPNPELYEKTNGIRIVIPEGIPRDITSAEYLNLYLKAKKYAGEYNRLLLKYLEEQQAKEKKSKQ